MTPSDRDNKSLVDNLLKQGVSKQEIEKVHRDLRDRGYGEEEARRRSQLALEKMKARREMEERRQGRQRAIRERRRTAAQSAPVAQAADAQAAAAGAGPAAGSRGRRTANHGHAAPRAAAPAQADQPLGIQPRPAHRAVARAGFPISRASSITRVPTP